MIAATLPLAAQVPADTSVVVRDTLTIQPDQIPTDTTRIEQDTLLIPTAPPVAPREQTLEHPINFSARDSLVILFMDDDDPIGDIGTLYGDARTEYDDAVLTAYEIDLLFQKETLRARGIGDDTTTVGLPSFQRGSEGFTGRELAYNLRTQRGRIIGARTQMQDGYVLGGAVTQVGERYTYAQDVIYTTCDNPDHVHWGLHTHRMKVVDGEWIYTGPAHLYILGIPTPLWLPFGFFPAAEGRRSGPLPFQYGEQSDLGFYLRNIGYYWAVSDYFDVQVAGGIYTSGSYEIGTSLRYARRYFYDGALQLDYRAERRGESQDPNFRSQQQVSVVWRHNQTLDAAGATRLSGNVNLSTTGYGQSIHADYDTRTRQTTSSNLTFTTRWRSGRNIQLGYSQQLNLTEGSTDITLPNFAFNQPRVFPFRTSGSRGQRWYEQISIQYSLTARNSYRFRPLHDTTGVSWLQGLFSADDYFRATGQRNRFEAHATHSIPVSASYSIRRVPLLGDMQLDIGPSLNYREEWFSSRQQVLVDEDGFAIRDSMGNLQFETVSAFAPIRTASLNASASTRIFGIFPWRVGSLDGFRHELRPSVSLSYTPDYSNTFWGQIVRHENPDGSIAEYPIRPGTNPGAGAQQSLSFSLNNVFQTRLVSEDTTGAVQRRAITLLTLNATGGYIFSLDSLQWQNVNVSARSTIANRLNLNLTGNFSPYAVNENGQIINQLYYIDNRWPLRFTRATFNASTQLRGNHSGSGARVGAPTQRHSRHPELDDPLLDGLYPYDYRRPDLGFVDFSIPWSLSLDFHYSLTRSTTGGEDIRRAALNTTFDLGLTEFWRINGRTGFDFDQMDFVPTQISIMRDLHCWEMSLSWIPFGSFRAVSFSIYLKSGHLRDLLRLNVPNVDQSRVF